MTDPGDGVERPGEGADDKVSAAAEVYLRLKALTTGRVDARGRRRASARRRRRGTDDESVPYGAGRDPRGIAQVMDQLTTELGWRAPLAKSEVMAEWGELVGAETAAHSEPVSIEHGVLTVQCASTAWATQLRIMRNELLKHLAVRFPDARIESIRFLGPDVPTWKRGPRAVPGRGPRDTYG